jgi:signal transduction histidine kinase
MRILLLFILFFYHALSLAQGPSLACALQGDQTQTSLYTCTESLSPSQALQLPLRSAHEASEGQWVKVKLAAHAKPTLIDIGIPDAYWIEVFSLRDGLVQRLMQLDERSVFSDRPILHRRLMVPLDPQAQASELVVHFHTHGKTPLQMQMYDEKAFLEHDALSHLLNGAIFGFLIVVVPLLVLVFSSVHNSNYRIYAGLVLSNLALLSQFEGYGFQYLWPDSPVLNMKMPGALALVMTLWHILFAIRFLQMRTRMLKLYLWHIAAFWLHLLALVFQILIGVDQVAMPVAMLYAVLALIAAVHAQRLHIPAARFYLIGTACQVLFVVVMLMLSITVGNPFPQISFLSYPKIGYVLEAIFFAAAVWNQIRLFNEHQAELRVRRMAETEQLLQAEQSKLQALEKAKQQQMQLASASHDIAQPLASLRFALAAMGQKPENKAVAEHVENTLNYAQGLLKELITQTRDEPLDSNQSFAVHDLLQQLLREFEAVAQQKGLRLSIHACDQHLQGSSVLLYRILSNLVSNAIRYTAKGRVVVGVRRRPGALEFQVWDTGPGIASDLREQLMLAFTRGEAGQQASEGFGLGLYIVNSLCRQCNYQLSILSQPGKGSAFCLRVPLA